MEDKRKIKKQRKLYIEQQSMLNDPSISHVMVKKNGLYYRPNACGYTEVRSRAGVFRKEEYASEMLREQLNIIPVDTEEHNLMILKEIKYLEDRLLPTL